MQELTTGPVGSDARVLWQLPRMCPTILRRGPSPSRWGPRHSTGPGHGGLEDILALIRVHREQDGSASSQMQQSCRSILLWGVRVAIARVLHFMCVPQELRADISSGPLSKRKGKRRKVNAIRCPGPGLPAPGPEIASPPAGPAVPSGVGERRVDMSDSPNTIDGSADASESFVAVEANGEVAGAVAETVLIPEVLATTQACAAKEERGALDKQARASTVAAPSLTVSAAVAMEGKESGVAQPLGSSTPGQEVVVGRLAAQELPRKVQHARKVHAL